MELGVQPWTAMESWMDCEQFKGFLWGNAIKYLARWQKKGGVEDLRKCKHYIEALIEQQVLTNDREETELQERIR